MRYNKTFNSFSSGELDPKLHSRTDIKQYDSGAEEVLNFTIGKSGGASRRFGSLLIGDITTSDSTYTTDVTKPFVFIPYSLADEEYVLILNLRGGAWQAWKLYRVSTGAITELFVDDPDSGTAYPTNQFEETLEPSGFSWVQIGVELYVTHNSGNVIPFKMVYVSDTVFKYTNLVHEYASPKNTIKAQPMRPYNEDTLVQMRVGVAGGSTYQTVLASPSLTYLEASTDGGTSVSATYFDSTYVGTVFRLDQAGSKECVFFCAAYDAANTRMTGYLLTTSLNTNWTSRWAQSYWGAGEYPRAISLYTGRLHLGGTTSYPNRFWISATEEFRLLMNVYLLQDIGASSSNSALTTANDFYQLFGTAIPADAFTREILAAELNVIKWMTLDTTLRVGTSTGDFLITHATDDGTGYNRDTIQIARQSRIQSTNPRVVIGDQKVLYFGNNSKRLRAIDSKSGDFQYRNLDLSILAEHLTTSGVKYIEWKDDDSTLWVLTEDNDLRSITINQDSEVVSWSKYTITDGTPVCITSVTNYATNTDEVILLVNRTIDGSSVMYLEKLSTHYLDCAIVALSGSPTDTFSGFDLLEGETVTAFYDGVEEEVTVSSGSITLSATTQGVVAGYPFTSRLKPLIIEAGQQFGNSRGNVYRPDRATVSLYESQGGTLNGNDIEYPDSNNYSGDINVDIAQSPDAQAQITIETAKALPLTVLGVTIRGVAYDA